MFYVTLLLLTLTLYAALLAGIGTAQAPHMQRQCLY
jgi:hypothetical protein